MTMLPSLHDDYLVAYDVQCEARQITLRARSPDGVRLTSVVFTGVEGYHFENDALGNIFFSLEAVPISQVLAEFGAQIAESFRMSGAPGPWAADLNTAEEKLTAKGIQAFVLSPSFGMFGWVFAHKVEATVAQPTVQADVLASASLRQERGLT